MWRTRRLTTHRLKAEGEDVDRVLVQSTEAKVGVVRSTPRLAEAGVVEGATNSWREGDVRMTTEILRHEAATDDRSETNRSPQR